MGSLRPKCGCEYRLIITWCAALLEADDQACDRALQPHPRLNFVSILVSFSMPITSSNDLLQWSIHGGLC
jgi:hypothetical protein